MPNPDDPDRHPYDDAAVAAAYIAWVSAQESRGGTLPDNDVVVALPARQSAPAQDVPLGEALHSYLNPYNSGAGELTAETLTRTGIVMENLEGLGWHIHPGVLNDTQVGKWTIPADLVYAARVDQLYGRGLATPGHVPVKPDAQRNEKRRSHEPDWAPRIRKNLFENQTGNSAPAGPAQAWALIGQEIRLRRAEVAGCLRIHPAVPQDGPRAAAKESGSPART